MKKKNSVYEESPAVVLGKLSLVHCMGTAGIPVITASENEKTTTAHSRYSKEHVVFSSYDSEEFIDELCELGRRVGKKAVPVTYDDQAMLNISKNRDRLKNYYSFLLPDHEMVVKLLDKVQFYELAKQSDLPIPQTLRISSEKDLAQNLDALQDPYLIKPSYQHYWFHEDFTKKVGPYKKAFICSTRDELMELYSKISEVNSNVVVQEYIVGEDSCMYDANFYVDTNGRVEGYVIAQKLRVYPPNAGWGSYVRTLHHDIIYNSCLDIIDKLDLKGMINIQFKRDSRTDEFKLIEIHTRTSIFDFLGAKAGQNIPALYYSALTGKSSLTSDNLVVSNGYKDDVRYIHPGRDIRLLVRYGKNYNVSFGTWAKSYLQTSVYDGLILKDFYAYLRGMI